MATRPNPETMAFWKAQGDDVESYPFVVIYKDKATWPACSYHATLEDAVIQSRIRDTDKIMERRYDSKGHEVGRYIDITSKAK
jgi:hypothetical protein